MACAMATLFAPVNASAPLRPCPAGVGFFGSGGVSTAVGGAFGSSTALVFSVFRRRTNLSAIACTAVLSVLPSASFRGARMAASMIRSSSSTFTSILRRTVFFLHAWLSSSRKRGVSG